jgi:hypothetical protein
VLVVFPQPPALVGAVLSSLSFYSPDLSAVPVFRISVSAEAGRAVVACLRGVNTIEVSCAQSSASCEHRMLSELGLTLPKSSGHGRGGFLGILLHVVRAMLAHMQANKALSLHKPVLACPRGAARQELQRRLFSNELHWFDIMQPVDEECLQPHEADLCLNFQAAGHADAAAAQCSAGPASPAAQPSAASCARQAGSFAFGCR